MSTHQHHHNIFSDVSASDWPKPCLHALPDIALQYIKIFHYLFEGLLFAEDHGHPKKLEKLLWGNFLHHVWMLFDVWKFWKSRWLLSGNKKALKS